MEWANREFRTYPIAQFAQWTKHRLRSRMEGNAAPIGARRQVVPLAYSFRKVLIGTVPAALDAGISAATSDAVNKTRAAATKATGSFAPGTGSPRSEEPMIVQITVRPSVY